jgi:hypothetical protein
VWKLVTGVARLEMLNVKMETSNQNRAIFRILGVSMEIINQSGAIILMLRCEDGD